MRDPGGRSEGTADLGPWESLRPDEALPLFADFDGPWWVGGGWAIDLFLGRETRPHADLDIVVLRDHQQAVREALPGWELWQAHDGELTRWDEDDLPAEVHGVWTRPDAASPWKLEVLFDERAADDWVSRRSPEVTMPLGHLGKVNADGVPYVVPEVVLLYKAKHLRPHDEADFEAALPKLGIGARCWLAAALEVVHPDHPWIGRVL